MEKTLKELADYVGGDVIGDESIKIKGVMPIEEARALRPICPIRR